jgi:uncharacterized protein (TIGR00251 family)
MPGFFVFADLIDMSPHRAPEAVFLKHDPKTGDCLVSIHVMPNASQTETDGLYGEEGQQALRVRLHALPIDGKANEALIKWLAKELDIAQRDISLARGQTSRRKQLRIDSSVVATARWERIIPST